MKTLVTINGKGKQWSAVVWNAKVNVSVPNPIYRMCFHRTDAPRNLIENMEVSLFSLITVNPGIEILLPVPRTLSTIGL